MWISFKVIDGGAFMQVRKAAYQALTRYSFETMELLEIARPLKDYSGLLLKEHEADAGRVCEALVTAALAYEHARRRRWGL